MVKERLSRASAPEREGAVDSISTALIGELPAVRRLALSYATGAAHVPFLALFALDAKLGSIVMGAREPVLAQIKLAWWRERLAAPPNKRPRGQPLLAALACWAGHEAALIALVDGWEAMLGEEPDAAELAAARGAAMRALAVLLGEEAHADCAELAGKVWSHGDVGSAPEADRALAPAQLPRSLRPLAVLAGLARRSLRLGQRGLIERPSDMLVAIRLGLLGR